ncbi:MAG: hypothetical protein QM571_05805 [Micrococcaceae bacterium]
MAKDNKPTFGVRLEGEELEEFEKSRNPKEDGKQADKQQFGVIDLAQMPKSSAPQTPIFTIPQELIPPTVTKKVDPPKVVTYAWWAWIIWQLLSTVTLILSLQNFDAIEGAQTATIQQVAKDNNLTQDQITQATNMYKPIFIVVNILLIALFLFIGYRMYKGKNWARIIVTLVSIFQVVSIFTAIAQFSTAPAEMAIQILIGVIAIFSWIPLWLKPAQEYFYKMALFYIQGNIFKQ